MNQEMTQPIGKFTVVFFSNPEMIYSCDEEIGMMHSFNHIPASQDARDTHNASGFKDSITKLNSVDKEVNKING